MKKLLIIGLVVIAGLGFYLLTNLNSIIKGGIETVGTKVLLAPVTLADCGISIFSGSGSLTGLNIGNPKGFTSAYAFDMDQIEVELDVKSVTTDKVHLKKIVIISPKIIYEGKNLTQLANNAASYVPAGDEKAAASKDKADAGSGKTIQIDYLKLEGAQISVVRPILSGKPMTVTLPTLELRDIGKNGKSDMGDALKEILAAINKAIVPAVQKGLSDFSANLPTDLKGVEEKAKSGLDSIKSLFGN